MSISRQKIVNNVSALMVSQAIGWGLGLLITIFLPRYLGVENWGKLSLAGSFWVIISNFATFGMDTYLTREIARDRNRLDLLLSQTIFLRILFFITGSIFLAVYLKFTGYSLDTLQVIAILGLNCFINLMSSGISATVQALERMEILAIGSVLSHTLITLFSFIAIFMGFGIAPLAWMHSIIAMVILFFWIYSLMRLHPYQFQFSLENIKGFLAVSFSFFLLYIFINLYHQVDIVIISLLVDEKGVGLYSVADKLLGTIFFVPTIFMTVLFPTFSRLSKENVDALLNLFRKAFNMMIWTGTVLGLGTFVISNQIVLLIYGSEFERSGPVLALKAVITTCTFGNIILGMYLMSTDRQKSWLTVLAIGTITQIPLSVYFVPLFEKMFTNGVLGAALSCVITEAGMMVAGTGLLPKQAINKSTLFYFLRTFLAGVGMVFGTWWFRNEFILIPIVIGCVLYLLLSQVLKLFSGEEWQIFLEIVMAIKSRLRGKVMHTTM
jgi:O-antigen/teichoic acid export membrane protein